MHDKRWNGVLEPVNEPATKENADVPQGDDEAILPLGGEPYKAAGRPSHKPLPRLMVCLGKDGYRAFQYVHLDSDATFHIDCGDQVVVLRFAGLEPMQLTIRGRNLLRVYDYITLHRMPWIWRADRDFADGKAPVITSMVIEPVEESGD